MFDPFRQVARPQTDVKDNSLPNPRQKPESSSSSLSEVSHSLAGRRSRAPYNPPLCYSNHTRRSELETGEPSEVSEISMDESHGSEIVFSREELPPRDSSGSSAAKTPRRRTDKTSKVPSASILDLLGEQYEKDRGYYKAKKSPTIRESPNSDKQAPTVGSLSSRRQTIADIPISKNNVDIDLSAAGDKSQRRRRRASVAGSAAASALERLQTLSHVPSSENGPVPITQVTIDKASKKKERKSGLASSTGSARRTSTNSLRSSHARQKQLPRGSGHSGSQHQSGSWNNSGLSGSTMAADDDDGRWTVSTYRSGRSGRSGRTGRSERTSGTYKTSLSSSVMSGTSTVLESLGDILERQRCRDSRTRHI